MDFYVYIHKKKTTGEVFYVGKGRKFRAYQRHSRSRFWHSVVNHHGFDVEIVLRDVSESEAYLKEIELIALYGRRDKGLGSLVNLTDGGEGGCGFVLTEDQRIAMSKRMSGNNNPNSDKTIWNFYNVKTKEIFVGTKFEMTKNYPEVSIGLLFSKGTTKRWIVQGFSSDDAMRRALSDKRIVNSEPKNTNIYTWLNLETGEILDSTCRGLRKLYPEVNTKDIINQGGLTSKGWTTWENYKELGYENLVNHKVGKNNGNADNTIYSFTNLSTKEIFIGTRLDFEYKFGIDLVDLFSKARHRLTANNWCLTINLEKVLTDSRTDYKVYVFKHTSGEEFRGTRLEFYSEYGFKIHALFRNTHTAKSVKGWSLVQENLQ